MAQATLSVEVMRETLVALAQHGTISETARQLGINRETFQHRVERARAAFPDGVPVEKPFVIDELPSELPSADELITRRLRQFDKKKAAVQARELISVKMSLTGAFGIAHFGDPHVDDDGTDIGLLREHVAVVNKTEGLFGGNVGDYSNNWIGRLARLYGQQTVSAAEAWVLVEWLIHAVDWLYLVSGNHDCWSGSGDPIQWMARSARVQYEAHGMRLGIQCPNGRVIRINARHDFSGRSQWNTAHGPAKAAQMGWRDHILTCGHTHVSGYNIVRDPASGLISHALRVGSYKTFDRYAEEKGLPNQTFTVCPVTVIRPQFADDDNRLVTVFLDPGTGADFLTFLRRRKSER